MRPAVSRNLGEGKGFTLELRLILRQDVEKD